MTAQISTCEQDLLRCATDWARARQLRDLSDELLRDLTRTKGIDFATAVLYDRLSARSDVAELLSRFREEKDQRVAMPTAGHVALVPGALYREFPRTGADGRAIRTEIERIGWQAELVPVPSGGSPHQNAVYLVEWLEQHQRDNVVLVSLSKGGADVKCAMTLGGAAEAFKRVTGWINFGGILDGAPMVEWACSRWHTRGWYRAVCEIGGHDFNAFQSLRRNHASPLSFPLRVFPHIRTIHVVGVPLRQHLSSRRARRWHRRLSRWGPNDSVTLMTDVLRWPGKVFPVWGTDHYWQKRWDARYLVPFLLRAASNTFQTSSSLA